MRVGAGRGALPRLTARSHILSVALAAAVYTALTTWLLMKPYDVSGGVLVVHVLALVTIPLLLVLTRKEDDRPFRSILVVALIAKLVGTLLRYAVLLGVYGEGDAIQYDQIGSGLAQQFRQGYFAAEIGERLVGTGFIELLTGIVYTITGSTRLGGFLVFSWLGFWGLYLFYRAFRLACPQGEHRRYTLLLFFLPSMLFWPSSIGKEAWMTLTLGAFAYGVARLVSHHRHNLLWIAVGTIGSAMVRPHVTLVAVVSLMVAYMFSGSRSTSYARPLSKMAGLVVLVAVFAFALGAVEDFFRLDDTKSIEEVLDQTEERTSKGGSEFTTTGIRSPVELPLGVFSVIFRPLPFEAGNAQALLASLEGVFLLVVFLLNWRRLGNLIPRRHAPFVVFVSTYSLLFAIAFSNVGNFGILARQRTQLFPFLLVVLTVPLTKRRGAQPDRAGIANVPPVPAIRDRSRFSAATTKTLG